MEITSLWWTYKLSIISPVRVYNNNQMDIYAQQMIDSIMKCKGIERHFNDFELILVDDFSDNDSLKSLKIDSRMNYKYIRNDQNLGIGGARNAGFQKAEGKYIFYIDADDMVTEDFTNIFNHIEDDLYKDIQMYFVSFETISLANAKTKTALKKLNKMDFQDYSMCPVTASGKVVRRDKCVPFPEKVYLEDVLHNYRQLDNIDGKDNIRTLNDVVYWRYLNIRPTAYTRSNNFLQANRPSFVQLITQNPLCKGNFKDKAVSDLFRALSEIYDLRHTLKHDNVKAACISRAIRIFENISTQKWSH